MHLLLEPVPGDCLGAGFLHSGANPNRLRAQGSARGLVPLAVFKTVVRRPASSGVGSIPMRFRQTARLPMGK